MNLSGRNNWLCSTLVATIVALSAVFLITDPAHAVSPTVPDGEALHSYGYYTPNTREMIIDVADASATLVHPATAASTMQYTEGGGYDPVTDLTWLVTDNGICHLWSVAANGTATDMYDIRTIAANPAIDKCWALMTNEDGTAWVSAENSVTHAHFLMKVSLSNGALVGGILTPTDAITGMSVDPNTNQVWASTTPANSSTPGLYKLNLSNGSLTDRIDVSSLSVDIWDIAFDSSGRLWMSVWGGNAELASIIPTAANPLLTYANVGAMKLNGQPTDSDALWFRPATPTPPVTPELAATGNVLPLIGLAALLALMLGAGAIAARVLIRVHK